MNLTDQFHHITRLTQAARQLIEAIEQGRNPENEIRKLKRVIRQGKVKRRQLFDEKQTAALKIPQKGRVKPRRGVELAELVAALEAVQRIGI